MLRIVFAVLLAAALLGVAQPAVETARVERSATVVEGDLSAFETAARDLAARVPAAEIDEAPRRTVTIHVPRESPTTASVAFVALGGLPDRTVEDEDSILAYSVGGTTHVRRVPLEIRVLGRDGDLRPPGEPLVLGDTRQVTLLLLERNGEPVVVVTAGDPNAG